ncbi:YdiU family protein [Xinfangfangia sp. D13-10-4-6]|nr:YdiU family protein [Pseudogemmobacter hezensis]
MTDLPDTWLRAQPDRAPDPRLIVLNEALAHQLGLDPVALQLHGAAWFSGAELPEGADPIALAYAGHQFGGFSPSLGDGRAHLLGEFRGPDGRLWDLQLKGSGRTPFSRGGDGKAALGPMLREYLISEAMAALNVPTTRSLAVALTGEQIGRDGRLLPGAVLARVAASHIRVGTFQFFASRQEGDKVRALADYAIARHYPEIPATSERYLAFFDQVAQRQAALIAAWMGLGFVHGVMNTDNMAISGETIDYGPCAFIETYAPGTVFSSIDRQGRYALANQPLILAWNLARLAECLLPLIDEDQEAGVAILNQRLEGIAGLYQREWLAVMRRKLALSGEDAADAALIQDLLTAMTGADWTLTFRRLALWLEGDHTPLRALFEDFSLMEAWLPRWQNRLGDHAQAASRLRTENPAVIPRNHRVEEALSAATAGDMAPFMQLLQAVQNPLQEHPLYSLPAPQGFGAYVTFCGT